MCTEKSQEKCLYQGKDAAIKLRLLCEGDSSCVGVCKEILRTCFKKKLFKDSVYYSLAFCL